MKAMAVRGVLCLLLLAAVVRSHDGPHPDDPVKRAEHLAALALVDTDSAIHVHGKASDYTLLPTDDLYVPSGSEFIIDKSIDIRRLRFDGTLRVATTPLTIRTETLVGNALGHLSIPASASQRDVSIDGGIAARYS